MNNSTMTSFTYNHSATIPTACARRLVTAWTNRRGYPIDIDEITEHKIKVSLYAPSSKEHNRAAKSLTRILDRLVLHHQPLTES